MSTELANITGKLVRKSQGLRERYRGELEKLGGPERYALAVEISRLTQDQQEQISFAAQVQKEVIEAWTDEDYDDMGVDRLTADTELGFSTMILPLAELHTKTETRKAKAKERLEATWGEDWEDLVGDLMPPWPAEEFLRGLAVFSEKHANWAEAKNILRDRINKRLAAKKTRKVPWIMARDVMGKHNDEIVAGQQEKELEQPAGQVTEIERELSLAAAQAEAAPENTMGLGDSNAEAVDGRGSIPHMSSTIPTTAADNQSGAGANLNSGMTVEDTRGENIDDGKAREVEAVVSKPSQKCRRQAADEIEEEKKRRRILDVDERIE